MKATQLHRLAMPNETKAVLLGVRHLFLLLKPLLLAFFDLFIGEIFDVSGHAPLVAEWIFHLTEAIAPELIGKRHGHFGTRFGGALEPCVDVFYGEVEGYRATAECLRPEATHLR